MVSLSLIRRFRLLPVIMVVLAIIVPGGTGRAATPHGIVANGVLTVAEVGAPDTLDPLFSQSATTGDITPAVFGSLVRITPQGAFAPDLATSWSRSADGMRWTFTLAHHVLWQDGEPFTARDVVYTARLVNAGVGALTTLGFDHIGTIQAIGDDVVRVTLRSPYAPFLTYFGAAPILPEHVLGPIPFSKVRSYAAFNLRPIGTGPFSVTSSVPGHSLTLTANPQYFGHTSQLAGLDFTFVSDETAALWDLRHGRADILGQTINLSPAQFMALRAGGGMHTFATPGARWSHLDLVQSGFLVDATVRRALAYATPKAQIVRTVLKGLGAVADADQPPFSQYYNPAVRNSYPFDVTRARRMLAADGFHPGPDGIFTKKSRALAITLWGDRASSDAQATLRLIQSAWRKAGVATTIRLVDEETLFGQQGPLYNPNRFTSSTMNAVNFEWIDGSEPDDSYFWQSSEIVTAQNPDGGNYAGYSSARIDQLTAQAAHASDVATRIKLYDSIQRTLVADQPVIFLAWYDVLTVTSAHTHGVVPNPYNPAISWNANAWYDVR